MSLARAHAAPDFPVLTALRSPYQPMNRRLLIVLAVVGLHAGGLWALQTGLLQQAVATWMPVEVMAELVEEPRPPAPLPEPVRPVVAPVPKAVERPRPQPVVAEPPPAVVAAEPTPLSPVVPTAPVPPAPAQTLATVPVQVTAPAPPAIERPSSDAPQLNNRPPPYPPVSVRLGEQGTVVVRVWVETDGTASRVELATSSGYDRLDQTALKTALKWRYRPGRRNGLPEAMWLVQPMGFELNPPAQ